MSLLDSAETVAQATHWIAHVAVRVPCGSDRTLATATTRRLETAEEIDGVEIAEVIGLQPTLSATVVTVSVSLQTTDECSRTVVESALETVPGLEQIQTVTPSVD
jgi:hypothetical protein